MTYATLEEAVKAADSGDILKLGEGNYTLYKIEALNTKGKDLTFMGSGVDKTSWRIGPETPDPKYFGSEYNGDYSFDGAGTITFENMTLRSGSADYLGFIRANNTVIDNCVVNGKTFYWGYNSAVFRNTTFNPPSGDYAMWTYSSPTMTFDNCTFNASGKVINVYTDAGAGKHDINVNFNNCTFNSNKSKGKQALNINDSLMGSYKYVIKFTGNNTAMAARDKETCSQLFGFGGKSGNNTGRTDVKIEGELVWSEGKMLTHDYTDGQHDDKFVDLNDYEWEQKADGWYCTGHAKCDYCGYKIHETVKADATTETSCTENGKVVYTATFQHKCFAAQTRSDDLDPLGHDWGEPEYVWAKQGEDWYCTATRICKRDASHIEEEIVKATYEVTTPATTEKEGAGLYTATFKNDVFKTQTKDDVIAKLPVKTEEKEDQAKTPEAQPILPATGDVNAFAIPVVLAVAAAAAILTFVALRRKNQR